MWECARECSYRSIIWKFWKGSKRILSTTKASNKWKKTEIREEEFRI
jgi:hypothetical protein